ncbi:glycosyltransferase [Alkalicoccus daliensis]|uniref:Glycosyltransferase involved in cell wall bisynthesis n=1 Tax=Alkalicoccus daliensis TaxID=745820 RepID=A0A1H0AH69_9BACI|nr:glycosyltransferase [Alkalicoccus daliensis]SDN32849.1 Glycosyltransferase involved in cell wall bisynthesis [Alkalicoccus daliensis]
MHILIASPHFNEWRGNKITAERIKQGIENRSHKVSVISSTEEGAPIPENIDLVHGFHAYKFAIFQKKYNIHLPYILTLTGTDINQNLEEEDKRDVILQCLQNAQIIHAFDSKMKEKVVHYLPDIQEKIKVMPQSVELNKKPLNKNPDPFIFLLPAGIRKVKNITSAIEMAAIMRDKYNIALELAGPVIEENEYKKIDHFLQKYDWLTYHGEIPFADMADFYKKADVVLNTSLSEGQSSALLEAMAAYRPVLASDIDGNRGVIKHEYSGFLYRNEEEFAMFAERLINNYEMRQKIAENAYIQVSENNSKEIEINTLLSWYSYALK